MDPLSQTKAVKRMTAIVMFALSAGAAAEHHALHISLVPMWMLIVLAVYCALEFVSAS